MVSITHCVITYKQAQLGLVLRKFPGIRGTHMGRITHCETQGRILPPLGVTDSTFLFVSMFISVRWSSSLNRVSITGSRTQTVLNMYAIRGYRTACGTYGYCFQFRPVAGL